MAEPKPEKPPLNILEKGVFMLSPETLAAFRLGGLSRLVSHMVDRKAEFLAGKWKPGTEHYDRVKEIADEAVALTKLFSKKADVIVSPETKRYGMKAASAEADSENHPGRSEDKKIINHAAGIYAVFDGVSTSRIPDGGQLAAEKAAELTNTELSAIRDDLSLNDTQAAMAEAFLRINTEIIDTLNSGREHHMNAMTTASVVKIWKGSGGERKAIIANMGDSRVYIKRAGGHLELVTLDDAQAKMGRSPEDFRRLLKKFATINRQSELTPQEKGLYRDVNVITKSLGYSKSEVPEFTVVDLNPGDKLVITSDGVHDPVTDNDMEQRINSTTDMDKACQDILSDALRNCANYRAADDRRDADMPRGKHADDKTIVIVEIGDVLAEGIAPNPAAPEPATGSPTTPAPSGATEHTTRLPAPTRDAEPTVDQLRADYKRRMLYGKDINPPKTAAEKAAVRQIVEDVKSGALSFECKDRFIEHHKKDISSLTASGALAGVNQLWRDAGAGEWIDEAMRAEPVTPETAPTDDEVAVVKEEYKSQFLGGSMPSLPETDVKKAAFKQLVAENDPKVKAQFISYYQSESAAVLSRSSFDGLDAFKLLWREAGADAWMFEADDPTYVAPVPAAPETTAGPTPTAAETETLTTKTDEIAEATRNWRSAFSNAKEMYPETEAQIAGLKVLLADVTAAGTTDKLRVWLRQLARIGGKSVAKQFAAVDPVIEIWMLDFNKVSNQDKLNFSTNQDDRMATFEKSGIYELQLAAYLKGRDPGERPAAEQALQYVNIEKILNNPDVLKRLLDIVEKFVLDKPPTQAELIIDPNIVALAAELFLTPDELAGIVLQQFDVLRAQVVLEEKADPTKRKRNIAIAKGLGYLAATSATVAMGWAAAPALAIGAVSLAVTGTKVTDILYMTSKQTKERAAIAKKNTETLKKSLAESAGKAYSDMTPAAKSALENLASAISIAKRTELNQAPLSTKDLGDKIFTNLYRTHLGTERQVQQDAVHEYNRLMKDATADPALVQQAFVQLEKAERALDLAAEPYRRMALAQASLVALDRQSAAQETAITKSVQPDSKLMKVLNLFTGTGESAAERLGSMAVFASIGVAARDYPLVRSCLSTLSGVRAGVMLSKAGFSLEDYLNNKKHQPLTAAEVANIDVYSDIPQLKIGDLQQKVALERVRLTDTTFQREHPAEYLKLKNLIDEFDQKALFVKARFAHLETDSEAKQLSEAAASRRRRQLITAGYAIVGGATGFILGEALVQHAAQHLAETQHAQPGSTAEQPGAAPAAPDGTAPAAPRDNTAGSILDAAHRTSAATPDVAAPAPAAGSTPDATIPTPAGAAPAAEISAVVSGAPASPASSFDVSHVTKPEWTHATVHHHEGVSHALKEQLPAKDYVQVMKDTKITVDGEQVAIFDPAHHSQLGVRQEDALTIVADKTGGHTTLHFYDAKTHQEIPNDSSGALGKYFYKMGDTPAHHGASTLEHGHVATETHSGTHTAEVPSAQHPAVDSRQGFVDQWLHDRGFDQTSDVTAANIGGTPDYASTHDLDVATRQANAAYETSLAHASGSGDAGDHDEIAQSVGKLHGQHHGAKASHESGGGGVVKAEKVAVHPEAGKAVVLPPAAEVAPATLAKTGLDQYKPTDYSRYQTDVKHVLDTAGKSKVVGENGLIFTQKAGQILVDVPHSQGTPQVLDSAMYQAIQKEYAELVQGSPTYHGKFDSAVWITVVKNAEAARAGIKVAEK